MTYTLLCNLIVLPALLARYSGYMTGDPPSAATWERLVLFDGVCAFCDAGVRWLIQRDPAGRLHYAPLQGEAAAALRRRHPFLPESPDTLVLVERVGEAERVHLRSAAILRIGAQLQPPPVWLPWLRRLPAPLADAAYRLFARLRYPLFGRREACRVPDGSERRRFLA